MVGALISIIGVFLPWAGSENGLGFFIFEDADNVLTTADAPGRISIGVSVIILGLGIALFFAGRVLAVAIISIIAAVIAILVGIGTVGIAVASADLASDGDGVQIGAILQPIAPLVSLAGGIAATAKRRR